MNEDKTIIEDRIAIFYEEKEKIINDINAMEFILKVGNIKNIHKLAEKIRKKEVTK